ncbi:Ig-like domain repeat protein [Nocardioides ferulae]|uniref:Ig-like domain repeat protein n=1 Tax=Nocardioides ferulae TaxID=2340821 RepID=UPI000EADF4F7|nr:Ig-like domain repeat protein [Nocardioides ferulae]
MNFRRLSSRATVAAASTALAAGTLVGLGSTAAHAATVTNTYACSLGPTPVGTFDLTVTGSLPVPQYWAGANVMAGLLPVTASATVPDFVAGVITSQGITGASSEDFGFDMGDSGVPVPLQGEFSEDGSTWNAEGVNEAFTTPTPGTYDAFLPEAFSLTTEGGAQPMTLDCALTDEAPGAVIEDFVLLKQSSTLTAPKSVKVKKGKVAKIKVSVEDEMGAAAGKVVAVKGKKKARATLKNGTAVIKLGKLPVGKHKFTVKYAGNKSISGSSAKVVVKVTR